MRISADLLGRSPVFVNTLNQRELDLRGNRLQVIENLGMTQDEHEALDMSDNDVAVLENFPLLLRLNSLFLCNNRLNMIRSGLGKALPKLEVLVLTNNNIALLWELTALGELPSLRHLSLLNNPVTRHALYRPFVLFTCRHLDVLDFAPVSNRERFRARQRFEGEAGQALLQQLKAEAAQHAGGGAGAGAGAGGGGVKRGREQGDARQAAEEALRARIVNAIKRARTLDDVTLLQRALQERAPDQVLPLLEEIEANIAAATSGN